MFLMIVLQQLKLIKASKSGTRDMNINGGKICVDYPAFTW